MDYARENCALDSDVDQDSEFYLTSPPSTILIIICKVPTK